jgi:hypothetical protein
VAACSATTTASRVLPTPPAPVSVTRRRPGRRTSSPSGDVVVAAEQGDDGTGNAPAWARPRGSPADSASTAGRRPGAAARATAAGTAPAARPGRPLEPSASASELDGVRVGTGGCSRAPAALTRAG